MNTILIVEDKPGVRDYLGLVLSCEGCRVEYACNGEEVIQRLVSGTSNISLLVLDLLVPAKNGVETLREVRRRWPNLPVIALSGSSLPANILTVLEGGTGVSPQPGTRENLLRAIRAALPSAPSQVVVFSRAETSVGRIRVMDSAVLPKSKWSQKEEQLLETVAASDVPVLICGETGVGKEMFARKLHDRSRRAHLPFVKLNCAALFSELMESELCGHARAASMDASKNKPGQFEIASSGTVLLDEIGDMDFTLQTKLLQAIQNREDLPGSRSASWMDVRVTAATHCELEKAVAEKRFREDLYYRLNVIEIHVPPLRERPDEILPLSEFFLHKYSAGDIPDIPGNLERALMEHHWPGNVRELENVMRKYLILRSAAIVIEQLQSKDRNQTPAVPVSFPATTSASDSAESIAGKHEVSEKLVSMAGQRMEVRVKAVELQETQPPSILAKVDHARREAETHAIVSALNTTLWNRKQAAALLNIDYKALLYKMKKLGIGGKWAGATEIVPKAE